MLPDVVLGPAEVRRWRAACRRGWLPVVLWALAAVAGFAVYLRLARTRAVNSDGASQALEAWDILHGNLLMHGWRLTDVALYTTEIPEYMLVELARGLNQGVVHVAAAITYTLVVLFAAALAKGTATGREAALRIMMAVGIMLAPQLASGTNVLLSSPDHIGTSVPIMLAWLILDRAPRRWWAAVAATVILSWSVIGDQLVLVAAILPLIGVCAVRVVRELRRRQRSAASAAQAADGARGRGSRRTGGWDGLRYEAALAAGGLVAALVGMVAPHVMRAIGGYDVPPVASSLSPLHTIVHVTIPVTGDGFLLLGGAYFPGLHGAQAWFTMLHVVGVALAAGGVGVTAWRFFRGESLLPQLLLAGIAVNVAAYALGTHALNLPTTREMAPVLPFAAALAGWQLPRILTAAKPGRLVALPVLGLVLAGYVAGLALELTTPAVPAQNARLASWLVRHRFGDGLSGYWEANVVTLTSGGRVGIRALDVRAGRVVPHIANSRADWFDPAVSAADYVVLNRSVNPGYPGFTD
ncbi:MAG TPA: hypothetical protein VHF26_19545, partial [Trebonia sp.]|nr:hypothetical protein [Trebonia sp.]